MTHNYRELTAPELVTWFARLTKGYISKGRDAGAISQYMKVNNVSPTQVLLGIFEFRVCPLTMDIPTFLRGNWPLGDDLLADESELALHLTGQPPPYFYIIYRDLIDLDMLNADYEKAFNKAKIQVIEWVDKILNEPASKYRVKSK